jgi:hypothetical protein
MIHMGYVTIECHEMSGTNTIYRIFWCVHPPLEFTAPHPHYAVTVVRQALRSPLGVVYRHRVEKIFVDIRQQCVAVALASSMCNILAFQ